MCFPTLVQTRPDIWLFGSQFLFPESLARVVCVDLAVLGPIGSQSWNWDPGVYVVVGTVSMA